MHRLLLEALFLLFTAADAYAASCSNATCGGQTITYPFWLATGPNCGYPGLGISCQENAPILDVQFHQYRVLHIDYANHTVSLADVDAWNTTCPRLSFNLSRDPKSWLQLTPSNSNLTFLYSCKANVSRPSAVRLHGCPGQNTLWYVLPDDVATAKSLGYACDEAVTMPVLSSHRLGNQSLFEVLSQGFEMRYDAKSEQCVACEQSGGRCSYGRTEEHSGTEFTCFCDDGANERQCGDIRSLRLKRQKLYIIAGSSSIIFLCLLVFACLLGYKRYGSKIISKVTSKIKSVIQYWTGKISKRTQRIESFLQKNGTPYPKRFKYAEVKKITKSFAAKLGQGGFGAVYRGNLSDGRQVAVKILQASKGDGEDFINEVASISRTSHVNIVALLGFCLEGSKRALIYEYMPNGSLERYVFNSNSRDAISISWEKLFHIAVGIARGLEYLHRGCSTRIVHFDIKPHNILLDEEFCPKISDFGMAKLCINKESIISIGGARGTIGYIAPEVFSKHFGAVSSKSDVYSYGMMVLEMVGAREKNINDSESSSQYFPQWIYEHLDDYCVSASAINGEITEIVRKMIVVGLWCIQVSPNNRPTKTRVVEMLEGTTSGLELPPKVLLSFFEDRVMSLS
ncbi:LEAF RUST 10 DISEASE-RESISTANCEUS RECEPTOR-LIKE PROTEIN KINASE-like 2.1 isoform X3 [Lolium perenne]|uniref:LEAF RUST 10 DISEASE-RESISTANCEUS RECEPTOR-LIKE PROTEIN KINASE-like 2.1 isoform X3 n=1 Tax=Lolium perenne TaxID=4522 RepID=UPI0021F513DB|nr:LEAF RUST 10 DISEASE-RESISTANCE LOCUS RECEPTOR-LIKE PROTEIN KINASE-like 2.1 isoform X3 [Lolium perenne]